MTALIIHAPDCVCTRCCDNDAVRDNPIHHNERLEVRAARWAAPLTGCYGAHRMVPDGVGGGTCADCGHAVDREEL